MAQTDSDALPSDSLAPSGKLIGGNLPADAVNPLLLNVLFNEETAAELEQMTAEDGCVQLPAVKSFDSRGIVRMRRLFPEAGRFEERTRREGLHRWYEVYYDSSVPITKAAEGWVAIPGVEIVELNPTIHIIGSCEPAEVVDLKALQTSASPTPYPFNDPSLPLQWNFFNKGTVPSSAGGCDINVFPVWRSITTGSPEVIIGVVDGGIDFNHEDLAANMWHNPEKTADERYGYNFATGSYTLTPQDHGTHVAGIIAAVNNNGIGVAGIAGGDAAAGRPGVKLMSCQIFDGTDGGSGAEAIKWSADHGAVISQNSWGFDHAKETPKSLMAAVDYFIKYAGVDENGVQTGPMRGGIVFFAAGNENTDKSGNSYEAIINVAALGADFHRAYYSNFGDWVDVAAPGGDAGKGNKILSTLVGDRYGLYQGTSMACPHASGLAALIISQFQGEGLTPDEVARRITESATPVRQFNKRFQLGTGLINAYRAFEGGGGPAPRKPSDFRISAKSNNLYVSVKVPEGRDGEAPYAIDILYNTANFSEFSTDLMYAKLYLDGEKPGDTIEATLKGLDFNTVFYVAAAAEDMAGNRSELTERLSVTTGFNTPPVIEALGPVELTVKPWQTASLDFRISDADGHFYLIDLHHDTPGISLDTLVRDCPRVVVVGLEAPAGSHTATLEATDIYGARATQTMRITVLENHAPVVIAKVPDISFSAATETATIDLTEYVRDEDGDHLLYSVSASEPDVIQTGITKNTLTVTAKGYGLATVTVTAKDACRESCSFSFRVLVRDTSRPVDLFPNPVVDKLNIRPGRDGRYTVSICNKAGATIWADSVDAGPFNPLTVDMSKEPGGIYYVRIEGEGLSGTFTVAKK